MSKHKGTHFGVSLLAVALMLIPLMSGAVGSPELAVSYIVQAESVEAAAEAVDAVGGKITHELAIINAVGADLNLDQVRQLQAKEGVVLYENQGVNVSDTTGGLTVRDEFNDLSYSNNDGTVAWDGPWLELSDDGQPEHGDVSITNGRLQMREEHSGATRAIDLSTANSATLSFDFISIDNGDDYFAIDVSDDGGGTFVRLELILPTGDGQILSRVFQLENHIDLTADVVVRFRVDDNFGGSGQFASVDNVQVQYDTGTTTTTSDEVQDLVTAVLLDQFSVESYSNNDGTAEWSGDWVELNDNDNPYWGYVRVDDNRLEMRESYRGATRAADLSRATSATLSFDFSSVDNGNDTFLIAASDDGGQHFTYLESIEPTGVGQNISKSYQLEDYISLTADVRISFRISYGFGRYGEYAAIDNVRIAYDSVPDTHYASLVRADTLHESGIKGDGVTVAVIDTGFLTRPALSDDSGGQNRVLAQYNAIKDVLLRGRPLTTVAVTAPT